MGRCQHDKLSNLKLFFFSFFFFFDLRSVNYSSFTSYESQLYEVLVHLL